MSTISKLDPNVRRLRMLRRAALREFVRDIHSTTRRIKQGQILLNTAPQDTPEEEIKQLKDHLTQLMRFQVITEMTYAHLKKVVSDPSRTGAVKEAIFIKLGADPA